MTTLKIHSQTGEVMGSEYAANASYLPSNFPREDGFSDEQQRQIGRVVTEASCSYWAGVRPPKRSMTLKELNLDALLLNQ